MVCLRGLETDEAGAKSTERKRRKELRLFADKISGYGQGVHLRYPNWGRDRQQARFGRATSAAPRCSCHSAEPAFERAESPTGSVARVLEIERVKVHPWLSRLVPNVLEHSLENRETVECIS